MPLGTFLAIGDVVTALPDEMQAWATERNVPLPTSHIQLSTRNLDALPMPCLAGNLGNSPALAHQRRAQLAAGEADPHVRPRRHHARTRMPRGRAAIGPPQ